MQCKLSGCGISHLFHRWDSQIEEKTGIVNRNCNRKLIIMGVRKKIEQDDDRKAFSVTPVRERFKSLKAP